VSYYLISNEYDGFAYRMHELIFKNDTLVAEKFKLDCGTKTNEYKYGIKNDSIIIYNFRDKKNVLYQLKNNELWNNEKKQIYLTYDKLEDRDSFVVAVEGDIWNGNKIESKRKRQRDFKKFFKERIRDDDEMEQVLLKGYDSYIKFGAHKGAIEYLNI
jgi:mRNA-degrading endonuclease YafQ of YafQ-DinJ toxin-antitoxin module